MKISLVALEGQTDGYSVRLCEEDEDDASNGMELGHVHRQTDTPGSWGFCSTHQVAGGPAAVMTMEAANLEELAERFNVRFSAIDLPANRVENEMMERYAETMLHNIHELANGTNALPGFLAALADAVALVMVEDFNESQRDKTLSLFEGQVRKRIASRMDSKDRESALGDKLRAAFGDVLGDLVARHGGKKDDTTKH